MDIKPADPVETTFFVRYAETDQMGIVHHSVYPIWFEEGRSAWMRSQGGNYAEFEAQGYFLSVAEIRTRFIAPARYGGEVTVRTSVCSVQSRAMEVEYEVIDRKSRKILATGYTKHICIDRSGNVTVIPDRWKKYFCCR